MSRRVSLSSLLPAGAIGLLLALLLTLTWNGGGPAVAQEGEATAPARPSGLQASTTPGSLDVSVDWDDVEGADSYLVRWREAGPGNALNEGVTVNSSNADITLSHYGEWVVRVEACNGTVCGLGAARRIAVEAAPEPTPEPTAEPTPEPTAEPTPELPTRPVGLQVSAEAGSLDVSVEWDDVEGATSYLVRWREAGPGNLLNEGVEAGSSDAAITVAASGGWVVRVEACNNAGCGPGASKKVAIVPPSPGSLQLSDVGELGISASWDGVAGADEYRCVGASTRGGGPRRRRGHGYGHQRGHHGIGGGPVGSAGGGLQRGWLRAWGQRRGQRGSASHAHAGSHAHACASSRQTRGFACSHRTRFAGRGGGLG